VGQLFVAAATLLFNVFNKFLLWVAITFWFGLGTKFTLLGLKKKNHYGISSPTPAKTIFAVL